MRWFGFVPARTVPLGGDDIRFLKNGNVYLELFHAAAAAPPRGQGAGPDAPGIVRHIAFQTDNVDAFLEKMGRGADVTLGPIDFDNFIPGWRSVWLRDPDGVVVEISQGYHDEGGEEHHG